MRPKTKLQIEVWNLSREIHKPEEHEPYVISKHKFYYTTHYKNLICLECNHNWKPDVIWHEQVIGVECPNCKRKVEKAETQYGGNATRIITYSVVQVVGRFQVFRYFSCWKKLNKKEKPQYYFISLFEEWKEYEKNKSVIIGKTQGWSGDGFSNSDYEVRYASNNGWRGNPYDNFASDFNCPGAEFLPQFKKYELAKYNHDCDYRALLKKIERSTNVETLLKANEKELLFFAVHKDSRHDRYWSQIKIVMRNKYKIKDAGIWYDYLDLLRYFNKDIHNPKFICPANLNKEHDRFMNKKRMIEQREQRLIAEQNTIKRQQKLEKALIEYQERFQKFFDLEFKNSQINVVVLKNIDEFKEEGEELNHCVYTNEYYLKKDFLILSARVSGVRTETIEINLKTFKIMQSRGLKNQSTQYHDEILKLVNTNMSQIKKVMQQASKKETQIIIKNKAA